MEDRFRVGHLDVERLLAEWRWLCTAKMELVARNAFGDLFLTAPAGDVFRLDVSSGRLSRIASSREESIKLCGATHKKEEWFAESLAQAAAAKGLRPDENQCIGFTTPVVFVESRSDNPACIVDIYEHVSFLGDLHRQFADVPDGGKIRLHVKPSPSN